MPSPENDLPANDAAAESSSKVFQALTSLFVQAAASERAAEERPGSVVVMTEAWYVPREAQLRIDQYVEGHQAEAIAGEQFPREIHHAPISVTAPRSVLDIEGIAKDRHKELLAELRAEIQAHRLIIEERGLL